MAEISTWFEFMTTFVFNIGLAAFLLVVFSLLHGTEFFRRLHSSRIYNGDVDAPVKPMENPFAWLLPVWQATEEELIRVAGLDAAVFIRMFTFSIQLFLVLNLLCLPILLPLNGTAGAAGGVSSLSTSNIPQGSSKLWATFAVLYAMTFITCGMMWWTYRHMWTLRHHFLASRARTQHPEEFTLLVTDIPDVPSKGEWESTLELLPCARNSVRVRKDHIRDFFKVVRAASLGLVRAPVDAQPIDIVQVKGAMVEDFFTGLYGQEYLANQGVTAIGKAQGAFTRWQAAVRKLRRTVWRLEKSRALNRRQAAALPEEALVPQHRAGLGGCWGRRVESIPYWEEQVRERGRELLKQQELALQRRITGSAFVSFRSRRVASVAAQTVHSIKGSKWRLAMAPQPEDVIWRNVELRLWESKVRSHLGLALTVALIIFFYIPVTFVAGLTTMTKLVELLPFLKKPVQNEWFNGFLSSFLPGLGLRIILWIVPPLLMLLARIEGCISFSEMERTAAVKHFYVLLFNVFLGYTFTGTLLSQLQAIIDHPSDLVTILATSIPQTSSFFITYVVISGALFFLELLRFPIPLIRYLFLRYWVGKDIADREKLWNQGGITYHVFVPYQNLIITFGFVFAVISPLILPFVLLYSIIGLTVWKHQIMYVYSHPYQTGGLLWPHFVNHVFVALVLAQLTAVGEFGLKQAFYQAGWTIPLVVATLYFWKMLNAQYRSTFSVLPLELACAVDADNRKAGVVPTAADFKDKYLPECLREAHAPDLDSLVREAREALALELADKTGEGGSGDEDGSEGGVGRSCCMGLQPLGSRGHPAVASSVTERPQEIAVGSATLSSSDIASPSSAAVREGRLSPGGGDGGDRSRDSLLGGGTQAHGRRGAHRGRGQAEPDAAGEGVPKPLEGARAYSEPASFWACGASGAHSPDRPQSSPRSEPASPSACRGGTASSPLLGAAGHDTSCSPVLRQK